MAAGLRIPEEFLVRFNRLKEAANRDPQKVVTYYSQHPEIRDALDGLRAFLTRTGLERVMVNGQHGRKVLRLGTPGFDVAWREYIEKWRFRVIHPPFDPLYPLAVRLDEPGPEELGRLWKEARIELIEAKSTDPTGPGSPDLRTDAIEQGIADLRDIVERYRESESDFRDPDELQELEERCYTALSALDWLIDSVSLDIPDVFRRWQQVPVILMPAHVSNRYGASDKGSLLHLLTMRFVRTSSAHPPRPSLCAGLLITSLRRTTAPTNLIR